MGGAEGKPAKFGAGGVGTEGEPELCILGAEGKPIALKVGGAEEVEGVELAPMVNQGSAHQGKEEENKLLHQAAETQRCPLESQPFSSFLPWSP